MSKRKIWPFYLLAACLFLYSCASAPNYGENDVWNDMAVGSLAPTLCRPANQEEAASYKQAARQSLALWNKKPRLIKCLVAPVRNGENPLGMKFQAIFKQDASGARYALLLPQGLSAGHCLEKDGELHCEESKLPYSGKVLRGSLQAIISLVSLRPAAQEAYCVWPTKEWRRTGPGGAVILTEKNMPLFAETENGRMAFKPLGAENKLDFIYQSPDLPFNLQLEIFEVEYE